VTDGIAEGEVFPEGKDCDSGRGDGNDPGGREQHEPHNHRDQHQRRCHAFPGHRTEFLEKFAQTKGQMELTTRVNYSGKFAE